MINYIKFKKIFLNKKILKLFISMVHYRFMVNTLIFLGFLVIINYYLALNILVLGGVALLGLVFCYHMYTGITKLFGDYIYFKLVRFIFQFLFIYLLIKIYLIYILFLPINQMAFIGYLAIFSVKASDWLFNDFTSQILVSMAEFSQNLVTTNFGNHNNFVTMSMSPLGRSNPT